MIAAIDIGGTKVDAGWFAAGELVERKTYQSREWPTFLPLLRDFLQSKKPDAIAIGVAGPVVGHQAKVTNLPWEVDAAEVADAFGCRCLLMNDLQAHAHGLTSVADNDCTLVQGGQPGDGARGLIAAGTGLGKCLIYNVAGAWEPMPSEGSHTDFAPADGDDVGLWHFLRDRYGGHVSWERVVSGKDGFANLLDYFGREHKDAELVHEARKSGDVGRVVNQFASDGDELALKVMRRFAKYYGAAAGNLALTGLTTGGMFLSGGVTTHIKSYLVEPGFREAFCDKGRFQKLLREIPIIIVEDDMLALRGLPNAADGKP